MKKVLISAFLFAGTLLTASLSAEAIDFKAKGVWDFNFEWQQSSFVKSDGEIHFSPKQRLRSQIDIIASESLKGVVFFELGKTIWGRGFDGASIGTDGRNVIKLRYSYVDWVIPYTDLQVRMGLQPYALPGFVAGSTILDDDGAGVTVSAVFNDYLGATAFWMRALHKNYDSNYGISKLPNFKGTTLDVVGLTIPVTISDIKIAPWGMFALAGKKSLLGSSYGDIEDLRAGLLPAIPGGFGYNWGPGNPFGDVFPSKSRGNAWWAGLSAELAGSCPLHIAADGAYGRANLGSLKDVIIGNFLIDKVDLKRQGWYAALLAEYKFEYLTPGIIGWYSSGDKVDAQGASRRIPTIFGNWSATSFGYSGAYGIGKDSVFGNTIAGSWGVVVQLKDISFLENLTHVIRGARIQGTNHKDVPEHLGLSYVTTIYDTRGGDNMLYLTKKDYAWEVDFDTEYKIYKDLSVALELSYIRLELDKKLWNLQKEVDKNAYRAGLNMKYQF